MTRPDVVVIGAGLSGLTAAVLLHQANLRVTVLEAADRTGGRIRSVVDPVNGALLGDLGPTWVWPPYQPVVADWLHRLRVETFAQFNDGNAVIEGFGGGLRHQTLPAQHGMLRIKGGPQALVSALAQRLPDTAIRTRAQVVRLAAQGSGGLALTLSSGETIHADRVVLAAPLRVAAAHVDMPDMPPAVLAAMAGRPTWMAAQAKAVVLYPTPFWRDAGLSGRIASQTGPLIEAHDHTPSGGSVAAIFGFVGSSPAQRRADPDGLRKAILAQLIRCFGDKAAHPLALVVEDWSMSPLICTGADLAEAPQHPVTGPDILRQPLLAGRLFLAASETSDLSPGLIEGALDAGQRAANDILSRL